ncbi:hypothetical protein N9J80_01915 [Flavobacteriaceae bacterium]|jgi:hypothetical protein|nr:hypothetical protein [Flavobacteriaceae bacterium]
MNIDLHSVPKIYPKSPYSGLLKNPNRSRLVQKTIKNFIDTSKMGFSVLQKVWFDDLQGAVGVIKKLTEVDKKNAQNYDMNDPITLSDGTKIVVCNQWGKENLTNFISHAKLLGLNIKVESSQTKMKIN